MDAASNTRESRKKELLLELAELMVQEQVEAGVFLGTPHYSVIELQAVTLGRELSQKAQERAARAKSPRIARARRRVRPAKRGVLSAWRNGRSKV